MTPRSQRTEARRNVVKGQYQRFVAGHNARRGRDGRCPHGHVLIPSEQDSRGECRVCQRARGAAFHAKHPEYARKRKRLLTLRKYDLTTEQFDAMVAAQGGLCKICGKPPQMRKGVARLHIDHNHATGKVRDLLCYECNWALGKFDDSPALLQRAADYLTRHSV